MPKCDFLKLRNSFLNLQTFRSDSWHSYSEIRSHGGPPKQERPCLSVRSVPRRRAFLLAGLQTLVAGVDTFVGFLVVNF